MRIGPLYIGWGKPDPTGFFANIMLQPPAGRYLKMDRYREFRQVFLETEQGQRVLHQILTWCNMSVPSALLAKFDPHGALFYDGAKHIGMSILNTMNREPQEKPQSTKD